MALFLYEVEEGVIDVDNDEQDLGALHNVHIMQGFQRRCRREGGDEPLELGDKIQSLKQRI